MPLSHQATSKQLNEDARCLTLLKANVCHTNHEKKTIQGIIDHMLGLSDWHQDQAAQPDCNLLASIEHYLENMIAEIKAAGNSPDAWLEEETLLTQIRGNKPTTHNSAEGGHDPLIGNRVQIITGTYAGYSGTIESVNLDGSYNIHLNGQPVILKNQRPGKDFGIKIPLTQPA